MDVSTVTLRMFFEQPLDVPIVQWVLFVLVLTFVLTCVYLQMKDDHLDLRWLIMERHNKPSLPKIGQVLALLVSTWAFVVLVLRGELTETFLLFYMGTWTGSAAMEAYLSRGTRDRKRQDDAADETDKDRQ